MLAGHSSNFMERSTWYETEAFCQYLTPTYQQCQWAMGRKSLALVRLLLTKAPTDIWTKTSWETLSQNHSEKPFLIPTYRLWNNAVSLLQYAFAIDHLTEGKALMWVVESALLWPIVRDRHEILMYMTSGWIMAPCGGQVWGRWKWRKVGGMRCSPSEKR